MIMGALWLAASPALASDKGLCAGAYEEAQRQRAAGKLMVARAQLLTCQSSCPDALVQDCDRWRAEVEALIPRLRVSALDAEGKPTREVRVTEAGRLLAAHVGDLIELDPGEHELTFELSGSDPLRRTVQLAPGRATHKLPVAFGQPKRRPAEHPVRAPAAKAETHAGIPSAAYILGAVGLAGLVTGGALGVVGHAKRAELDDSCKPTCSEDDVDGIRTLWWAGGISAAVGAVALSGAMVIWQQDDSGTIALSSGARAGMPQLRVTGHF